MTSDLTLSQEVQTFIESLFADSGDGLPVEEREETEKTRRLVRAIVDDIISSRETVTEGRFAPIEKVLETTPHLIRELLDERFTRDVVAAVPGFVRRTLELSRLEGSRIPSKITNGYLQEAVRTYIFGFPQASIALSRAALEQALKEELGHQGKRIFLDMNGLLNEAEGSGTIDGVIRRTARRIATEADTVLHEIPADLAKAYDVLLMLRGVLQHIYAE
jgi:hypothetical protein